VRRPLVSLDRDSRPAALLATARKEYRGCLSAPAPLPLVHLTVETFVMG
jgi:hypothetical protein